MNQEVLVKAVQPLQEQKPLKISDDALILKELIRSPKLASISFDDTKVLLKRIMAMVGLKPSEIANTSEVEKQLLVNFIQKSFGGNTTDEFITAFEMAFSGKLNVDPECYQNFSVAYVSRIMVAYRKWASNVYQDNISLIEKPKEELKMLEYSPTNESVIEFWKNEWKESKNKDWRLFGGFISCYNILVKKGELVLSEDERANIKVMVVNSLINSANGLRDQIDIKRKCEDKAFIQPYCKKIAVARYFTKQIEMENF